MPDKGKARRTARENEELKGKQPGRVAGRCLADMAGKPPGSRDGVSRFLKRKKRSAGAYSLKSRQLRQRDMQRSAIQMPTKTPRALATASPMLAVRPGTKDWPHSSRPPRGIIR